MKLTQQEQRAWQRIYEAEQERRRIARTQPVTTANPVQQRLPLTGLPNRSR